MSRAGISGKFHLAVTNPGRMAEGFPTGGETAGVSAGPYLTEGIAGYPVVADRGYDSDGFRLSLEGNNNTPVIPGRKNRKEEIVYDRERYKKRGL